MDREWATYLENHVASLELPYGLEEQAAKECMDSCADSQELTHYQAHQILMGFFDGRGYS